MERKILNIGEAAALTRLKTSTLYAYIARRKVPFIKVGSRVLFDEEALLNWLQAHTLEPLSERQLPRARPHSER
jgi:excisionase family DNA binding protein